MIALDAYKDSIRDYATWESNILYAALGKLITPEEASQARCMAYLAHGYLEPARRSQRRINERRRAA